MSLTAVVRRAQARRLSAFVAAPCVFSMTRARPAARTLVASISGCRSLHYTARCPSAALPRQEKAGTPAGPVARYEELVQDGVLRDDAYQRSIVSKLQALHEALRGYEQKLPDVEPAVHAPSFFSRFFKAKKPQEQDPSSLTIDASIPKGLYLFGDVGTGKSMLMDMFYDTLPATITRKQRIHFHQFMMTAHQRMHKIKALSHKSSGMVMSAASAAIGAVSGKSGPAGGGRERRELGGSSAEEIDATAPVALEFAKEFSVLCFDEFQVTDIADAMILRRLLEHMLAYGVVIVMTSNRHPDNLYQNGIQRSSFIPCIELIKKQLKVTDLNSGTDYRKIPRALSKVYFSSQNSEAQEFDKLFTAFTSDPSDPIVDDRSLTVWGRQLKVPRSSSKVARFTFTELCGKPKSAADYLEIVRTFPVIFVEDVPRMGMHQRDLARRLITFIDAAYESKTKIFISSQAPILQIFSGEGSEKVPTKDQMRSLMDDLGLTMDQLGGSSIFTGEEELFAFARVLSRLTEMGTAQWADTAGPGHG